MPAAVLSVGPMPEPVSRYQVPEAAFTSTPASFHNRSSALWVPLSSPREANGAAAAAIFARAAGASAMPLMPAGSACGPTMMKSLYMTSKRFTPKPSATNCSSDFLSCTNSTSASPFLARSMAWPVPLATTRTSMPVFFVNNGSRYSNSPESWVEVVDATTMKRSSASVGAAHNPTPRSAAPSPVRNIRLNMTSSLLPEWSASPQQFSLDEGRRLRRQGPRKELHRRPLFEQTAAMQEDDLIGKPPRLAEVVCGHDDLRAAQIDGGDDILDGARCRRVQIGRRLVEKEHLRRRRPGAGERQPLLFADRERARRAMGELGEAGVIEHFANPGAPQRPRDALEPEGVVDIGGRRAAQHDRVLEYHGLAPAIAGCTRSAPADGAGGRLQQPVAEAQQQALAGAVGSENDGARTAADRQRDAVDQPLADGLEGEVVKLQRQDRSRCHRRLPASPMAARGVAQDEGGAVDDQRQRDQDKAEAERQREIALAGLERDRRRHHARDMVDVAADDHHRADFGRSSAETGEHGRYQAEAAVPQQRPDGPARRGAERPQLLAVFDPQVLDHLAREGGDDRRDQHGLGDDHRQRREQQAEHAERPAARQQQVDDQPDNHRRQPHERAQQHGDRPPPREPE